jgi:hypothetical protein
LMAQREAERSELSFEIDKKQQQIRQLNNQLRTIDTPAKRKPLETEIQKLEKSCTDLAKAGETTRLEINKKYDEKLLTAKRDLVDASASGLCWLQFGVWTKILLDLPKLLGCFLIVFATFKLVVDPQAPGHLKSFAIVCSTIVLLMATLWSVVGLVS